jgi:hypothetical protein
VGAAREQAERQKAAYEDEVGRLVHACLDVVTGRDVAVAVDPAEIEQVIDALVADSAYAHDDGLAAQTLVWSRFPTAYFAGNGAGAGTDRDFEMLRHGLAGGYHYSSQVPWDAGRKPFPWGLLAGHALAEDVADRLYADKRVLDLFMSTPRAGVPDGEEEGGDGA